MIKLSKISTISFGLIIILIGLGQTLDSQSALAFVHRIHVYVDWPFLGNVGLYQITTTNLATGQYYYYRFHQGLLQDASQHNFYFNLNGIYGNQIRSCVHIYNTGNNWCGFAKIGSDPYPLIYINVRHN